MDILLLVVMTCLGLLAGLAMGRLAQQDRQRRQVQARLRQFVLIEKVRR